MDRSMRGDIHLPFATPRFGTPCAALLSPEERQREHAIAEMMMGDMDRGLMGAEMADPTLEDDEVQATFDRTAAATSSKFATIRAAAEDAGRDSDAIGLQVRISDPHDLDRLGARLEAIQAAGFGWVSINMPMLDASGVHGADAQVDMLGRIHDHVRGEVGALAMRS